MFTPERHSDSQVPVCFAALNLLLFQGPEFAQIRTQRTLEKGNNEKSYGAMLSQDFSLSETKLRFLALVENELWPLFYGLVHIVLCCHE